LLDDSEILRDSAIVSKQGLGESSEAPANPPAPNIPTPTPEEAALPAPNPKTEEAALPAAALPANPKTEEAALPAAALPVNPKTEEAALPAPALPVNPKPDLA
jgi:hypothetical protein